MKKRIIIISILCAIIFATIFVSLSAYLSLRYGTNIKTTTSTRITTTYKEKTLEEKLEDELGPEIASEVLDQGFVRMSSFVIWDIKKIDSDTYEVTGKVIALHRKGTNNFQSGSFTAIVKSYNGDSGFWVSKIKVGSWIKSN
jgi:hypothetical protein